MKKIMKSAALVCAVAMAGTSFAQLQDEQNVTITMDLQPILQLKMEGPSELNFTFDEINKYYAGITKYGATVLRVSSTVSFDLWAAGYSQGSVNASTYLWDNPVTYGALASGTNRIPVTALELHQFPANPAIAQACAVVTTNVNDYSAAFGAMTVASTSTMTANSANGDVYAPLAGGAAGPYTRPTSLITTATDKYIAGGTGTGTCGIAGGSYLLQGTTNPSNFYYVLDYRILPNLPVTFPSHFAVPANAANVTAVSITGPAAASPITATGTTYANPGVYTMYVKYILAEDL